MAKKPFPFSVCEQCCVSGGGAEENTQYIDALRTNINDIISGASTIFDDYRATNVGSSSKYNVENLGGVNGTIGSGELIVANIMDLSSGADKSTQILHAYDMDNAYNAPISYARQMGDTIEIDVANAQTVTEHHTSEWTGGSYNNSYYHYTAPEGYKIVSVMYTTGTYAVMLWEEMNPTEGKMPISVDKNTWCDVEPCDEVWLWESNSELTGTDVKIKIAPIKANAWNEWVMVGQELINYVDNAIGAALEGEY